MSGATPGSSRRAGEHDRPRDRDQERFGAGRQAHQRARRGEVPRHQRERFFLAELALPQRGDGWGVARVTRQVVPAEALHGEDPPRLEQLDSRPDHGGVAREASRALAEVVVRSAVGTGHRLRVEAAARGVMVLPGAAPVHRPRTHRGAGAVVGQTQDDRVAGTAVGAVDVGIVEARVGRVEQFLEASFADGEVRGDANRRLRAPGAFPDDEVGRTRGVDRRHLDVGDARRRRRLGGEVAQERIQPCPGALDVDFHAVVAVQDPAGEGVGAGEPEHERAESHPLHHAPDADGQRARRVARQGHDGTYAAPGTQTSEGAHGAGRNESPPSGSTAGFRGWLAAVYSPTDLVAQYHRRCRA